MRRLPLVLLAVPALGLARLLPQHGAGLAFRLGAATACVLLPGALVARALRLRGLAAALAWSLGAVFAGLAITFLLNRSLSLTLAIAGACGLVALPFALRREGPRSRAWPELCVLVAGVALGIALWHVAALDGDAFFHLARVRKLDVFGSLSLRDVGEFRGGGLHPGYAFPLWHGVLALVARLAGVDPIQGVLHGPTVFVPLSFVLVYEAAAVLFRSAWLGMAAVFAQVALTGLAAGHGGAYPSLALPGTAALQLLVPAVLALAFAAERNPGPARLVTASLAALGLAAVHPTYAVFLCIPLVGFLLVRPLLVRGEAVGAAAALAVVAVPTIAFLAWLRPIVNETTSHNPALSATRRALANYPGQLDGGPHSFRLAPALYGRGGAIAVAALLVVPLAGLAAKRRWAAYVLGGSLALFAVTLLPFVFTRFADAVSISQARRAAGFLPFAFALSGGAAVLAGTLRLAVLPLALAAGIALQRVYPGDFGYRFEGASPDWATWIAVAGGAFGLATGIALARWGRFDRRGPVAAAAVALFVLPVAVHGFSRWSARPTSRLPSTLVKAARTKTRAGDVVFADPETGYLLAASAPVYLVDAPLAHVADTSKNRPRERLSAAYAFFAKGGDLSIPGRYGASWILVDRKRRLLELPLARAYADGRYVLYRLR